MSHNRPRVLIEDWLPIEVIGAEVKREHAYGTPFPAPNRLHVWWARRPLLASRAGVLASLLPSWSDDWPEVLKKRFSTSESYHNWFIHLIGIRGDPVQGQKLLQAAKARGVFIKSPFALIPRAFSINPSSDDLEIMHRLLEYTWGNHSLNVLDPFAGGGSIPFEALRYGFTTISNDLNPVAATILKATLEYPTRFGTSLAEDIRKWGKRWYELTKPKLESYFTSLPADVEGAAYLWARTVTCPVTGKPVPLTPNWWLRKGSDPVAIKLIVEKHLDIPQFTIVRGHAVKQINPDAGTINRGVGRSPWNGETISGKYIKSEAQAGRMGQILYAVALKKHGSGFEFRAPTIEDYEVVTLATQDLTYKRSQWITKGIIPSEHFPEGNDNRPIIYGMSTWSEFFAPRQLLAFGSIIEAMDEVWKQLNEQVSQEHSNAIRLYMSMMLDKMIIYNNRNCRFDPGRGIRSNFDRHDYAFVPSYSEFDASANLLPWAIDQVVDAYKELAILLSPAKQFFKKNVDTSENSLTIYRGSATTLSSIVEKSIHNITVDPPYYDNVQYAELSDFFYVWLKRSVGPLFPEFFSDELTNKDDEAVANPARFAALGSKKKKLAEQDYERKMAAAFQEMHRVLHPDGVLTVMFTHKKVEAWDTLASALIGAGFTIQASWPVHTESEHSLHQAKKNAAASTILLVCRKRRPSAGNDELIWWEDIQGEVRRAARQKAQEYQKQGIQGVDLYISTFGPTLSVISRQWPVLTNEIDEKTGNPKPLRPEIALDLAREEVVRLRKEGLLAGRNLEFDAITDWVLMAWDAFQAEQFPYDEARKLAIALGLDLDNLLMRTKRLVVKSGQFVILQGPAQRRKKGMVDADVTIFEHWIDALHTAMLVYAEDGAGACEVSLVRSGLRRNTTFIAGLQALINVVPRTQEKGKFVRPEAEILDRIRLALYPNELTVPVELEPELSQAQQGVLLDDDEYMDDENDDTEEDEE